MSGGGPAPAGPEVAVGVVVVDNEDLLLVRRGRGPAAGEWAVPGGRVRRDETLAEAVVREVAEETGLEAVCGRFLGWVERMGPGYHFVILDFEAAVFERSEPVAGDDAAEAAWVPLVEVCDRVLVDGLAEFLHEHGILEVIT